MEVLAFWREVTEDHTGFLQSFLGLLDGEGVAYCVVGGQAVNAYAEPVVSLDLDIVVAARDLGRLGKLLEAHYRVERFEQSLNVSAPGSALRIQVRLDPRYDSFVDRCERRRILGLELPVARLEDVLRGKVWAAADPSRRPSKRQKDLADISRLLESHPELRFLVPEDILARLF